MKESEEDTILLQQGDHDENLDPVRLMHQPSNIEFGKMRQYQLNALNWMIRLHDIGCNGILADEMGLGKTLESISLLAYLKQYRNVNGPHLVIVPKSTSGNWMREFKRWCPSLTAMLFHGDKVTRETLRQQVGKTDVCVTTYSMCKPEKSVFSKIDWYYIYIDEAHRLKNDEALISQLVRSFPSKHRLLITGTPLQNNLKELWALLNFLLPDIFDSSTDFTNWFDVTKDFSASNSEEEEAEKKAMVRRLHTILRPFLLRRLKKDVEKDLPPKVEMKVFTGLTVMQKAWYTKLLERDIDTINSKSGSRQRLMNIVMQLRKICNHPYLFDGAEEGPPYFEGEHIVNNCGKMILLDKLLKRLKENGSRVLIFSTMTRMLDILEDYCRYRRYKYCRIDGQTKQIDRDARMDDFNAEDSNKFIFLLSTRAGGLGINLQTADTVVLYDSDWNPQMDLQAMDRAHRIGQKKPVNVYRFVTDGSIEVKVVERAYKKLFLNAVVIREGRLQEKGKGLQTGELMKMVRFGAKEIFRSKEATVSDEDIEAILQKSKQRTKEDEDQIKNAYDANLRDFSLDVTDSNYQTFEGKDYTKTGNDAADWFIAPSKRDRGKYSSGPANSFKRSQNFRPTLRHDFQFFNRERLAELERKVWDGKQKLKEIRRVQANARREENRRRRNLARLQRDRQKKASALAKAQAAEKSETDQSAEKAETDQSAPSEESKQQDLGVKSEQVETDVAKSETVETEAAKAEKAEKAETDSAKSEKAETEGIKSEKVETDKQAKPEPNKDEANGDSKATHDAAKTPTPENRRRPTRSSTRIKSEKAAMEVEKAEQDDEVDDDADANEERENQDSAKSKAKNQQKEETKFLTKEEQQEKEELEAEGFPTWTRQNLTDFVAACARFGRDDIDSIREEVPGQDPDEVERYHDTFWPDRHVEIHDHKKLINRIEKGEKKLAQEEADRKALADKVGRHKKPLETMSISYGNSQASRAGFSIDEDRFLIVKMHEHGFGNWDDLTVELRNAWQFRFNWFIKSRTLRELQTRCKKLLELVKDDNKKYEADNGGNPEARRKALRRKAQVKSLPPPSEDDQEKPRGQNQKEDVGSKGAPSSNDATVAMEFRMKPEIGRIPQSLQSKSPCFHDTPRESGCY
eukprot:CAMPEP_0114518300 /NCGR_PEP_ID=MMETSP0109-20121206/18371_1 /TAXON_ID=29199 /ORGANISM="Chlorarachnion reptans, Strain CCCM449" /LENGTH=1140 /DNA_ID=CAMNT_0001698913 /DNA_START=129 /DNA_END=3552 /DNA_ORIENTATION=-